MLINNTLVNNQTIQKQTLNNSSENQSILNQDNSFTSFSNQLNTMIATEDVKEVSSNEPSVEALANFYEIHQRKKGVRHYIVQILNFI